MRPTISFLSAGFLLASGLCSISASAQEYRTELISHTTVAMTTGDLDGDGDVDIISGGIFNLVWNENNGDGTFERHTISLDVQEAQCVVMVDLDQDGHQDLVVADMAANRIMYFRNLGDNTFDRFFLASGTTGTATPAVPPVVWRATRCWSSRTTRSWLTVYGSPWRPTGSTPRRG